MRKQKHATAWDSAAKWYNTYLEETESTYQRSVILPNLTRLVRLTRGQTLLDLGCGQGFYAREFARTGARVIGIDASHALITYARRFPIAGITYYTTPAQSLSCIKDCSVDAAMSILALQNMDQLQKVLSECARVLKPSASLFLVLNHPAFRIPKSSEWGWDASRRIQYRRMNAYLSESKQKIQTHPGAAPREYTLSFHRPLQTYFKHLASAEFTVSRLEEWTSHKKSQPGPRARAENYARQEIPLFLFLQATKKR